MYGQSGTFDPFWDDLGPFMSKTLKIDREQLSARICSKNLFILRFPQLVFVMTSPLIWTFTTSINLNSVKCAARKVGFPGSCACAYSMGAKVP